MSNLKRMVCRYMQIISLVIVVILLLISLVVQVLNEQRGARENADATFNQMKQLLEENQRDLNEVEEEYSQTCLKNAEAIAYLIEHHSSVLYDVNELKKIAEFMEVDEIHIFDENGCIYTGTHPEYYGYTFDSGEQMAFFKPMLKDKTLRLCQDITPNTAESKMMQYSALWSENKEFIVQVGMEPVNVMRVTEKNELSYIFSLLRVNIGVSYYAISAETGDIVGATVSENVGKNFVDIGFKQDDFKKRADGFHTKVDGVDSYCVFTQIGDNYIGRVISNDVLYQRIPDIIAGLAMGLISIALILVFAVTGYMNRFVIDGIYNVNQKLRAITKGNLDERVDVKTSLEFSELSTHINEMVQSLLSNTDKISYVLNKTNMNIGVYEYNENMKHVRYTECVPSILRLDRSKEQELFADYKLFREYIDAIRNNPVPGEEGLYCLAEDKEVFVRFEEITQDKDVFGIVIDVTEEIIKRRQAEAERDMDLLTGLYNRRGFENRVLPLIDKKETIGHAMLIMIDADGLKEINDCYGHDKGDIYLKKIAAVLESFGTGSCISSRFGGDEFVLFLYNYNSEQELNDSIETLHYIQHNSAARLSEEVSVSLRFSFGFATLQEEENYKKILKLADGRMYDNKRKRKKVKETHCEMHPKC